MNALLSRWLRGMAVGVYPCGVESHKPSCLTTTAEVTFATRSHLRSGFAVPQALYQTFRHNRTLMDPVLHMQSNLAITVLPSLRPIILQLRRSAHTMVIPGAGQAAAISNQAKRSASVLEHLLCLQPLPMQSVVPKSLEPSPRQAALSLLT